jgi:hypothetical protein
VATSIGDGASVAESASADWCSWVRVRLAIFETLLLKAGQPLQPSAPPVPLHRPPPGHEPVGVWSAATYVAIAVE